MSEKFITKTWDDIKPLTQDRLDALDAITDEDIERAVAEDPDAPPLMPAEWWAEAELVPPRKMPVSLRLDPDILEFFKSQGPGYQTRINAVLRKYMESVRKAG
jgi:uncharacterized protein (DUF4415 family)